MFEKFLVQPLFNLLILIYNLLPVADLGLVVILFTLFMRLLLWPLFLKSIRSQVVLTKIQAEAEAIQKKYKSDKEEQMKQMLALYKNNNFNPFVSFFAIFIQLPILLAVYRVFWLITDDYSRYVYAWVTAPASLNHSFFNLFDLTQPNFWVVLLATGAQFVQVLLSFKQPQLRQKQGNKAQELSAKMSRNFTYFTPILTFFIFRSLPSVLSLYWLVSTLVSILQQILVQKELAGQASKSE